MELVLGEKDGFGAGTGYSGGLVVKTDEANAAPMLTKSEMESALKSWLSGRQLLNALKVLDTVMDCQESPNNVNAVFTYAVMMQECGMGTANTSWVRENNWTSLTGLRTYKLSITGCKYREIYKHDSTWEDLLYPRKVYSI